MKIAVLISGQMRDYKINITNHIKHLIEPNSADVFVYACTKNTIHSLGQSTSQKYNITSVKEPDILESEIRDAYGEHLVKVRINTEEELDDDNFGTLGYFKKRMNNQMTNIRECFKMAVLYSKEKEFEYDFIIRLRPDNSMLPNPVDISSFECRENLIHSTVYPSGHRDPWFFSFSKPNTFEKYCSFEYMRGADESRTDNNFDCPEISLGKYLVSCGIKTSLHQSICRPFYEYDKTKPIVEFPHVNWDEKLLDPMGNWVSITNKNKRES